MTILSIGVLKVKGEWWVSGSWGPAISCPLTGAPGTLLPVAAEELETMDFVMELRFAMVELSASLACGNESNEVP